MPTVITKNTTWAAVNGSQRANALSVRPYWLPRTRGTFLAAELALLGAALYEAQAGASFHLPVLIVACAVFFHVRNLDRSIVNSSRVRFWSDVVAGVALGLAASAGIVRAGYWLGFGSSLPNDMNPVLAGAFAAGLMPVILRPVLKQIVSRKKLVERILIVGTGELAGKLQRALASNRTADDAVYLTKGESAEVLDFPEVDSRIDPARLHELIRDARISRVVVAEQDPYKRSKLAGALLDLRMRGVQVSDAVDFYEKVSRKIWVEASCSEWFVYADGFHGSRPQLFFKRAIDVLFGALLLILTAPLWVLITIAVKLDSKGPVLFRQERVGLYGRTFVILKFRSMRGDAEDESGPIWASRGDPRATRIGGILRFFRLDEIPQILNVLRGEMSLVGPRPERPYFVDWLTEEIPFYKLRHYVRPGITGWAQVMYRYGASVEDAYQKLQYDLYYAKNWSIGVDVGILFKTVKTVLIGRG